VYWFDPVKGVRVDPKTHMVDVKPTVIGCIDDPFILASQAQQVYYASYPSKAKEVKDWLAVVKTSPRGVYELTQDVNEMEDDDNAEGEHFFQENERVECMAKEDLDNPISFVHENGRLEEVDDMGDDDEVEFEATHLAYEYFEDTDEEVDFDEDFEYEESE